MMENSQRLAHEDVRQKVLIVLELDSFFIGDTLIKMSYLKMIYEFWRQPLINIVCNVEGVCELLMHNPYVVRCEVSPIESIDPEAYAVIIVISYREKTLLRNLEGRNSAWLHLLTSGKIISLSQSHFKGELFEGAVFPQNSQLNSFIERQDRPAAELFIQPSEREWADLWLAAKGVSTEDKVVVLVDSTSHKDKLMNTVEYFSIVRYFLGIPATKVLIFDEHAIGKRHLYAAFMEDDKLVERVLFAEGVSLRQALCILSSNFVKVVIGPSSGLLHCISAIYKNGFEGEERRPLPLMIAYVCKYSVEQEEWNWWQGSLTRALLIRNVSGENTIELLTGPGQKCTTCDQYTAGLLIKFIEDNYSKTMAELGMIRA